MIPASRFERVYEAAQRGKGRLLPEMQAQLGALFEPDTLFTLAVLVALWAGAQLTPIGAFADVALLIYSGWGVLKRLWEAGTDINDWVTGASAAKTDEDLDRAGAHFARAVTTIGVEALLAVVSLGAFRALRAKVRSEPTRFGEVPKARPIEAAPAEAVIERPIEAAPAPAPRPTPRPPLPVRPTIGGAVAAAVVAAPGAAAQPLPLPSPGRALWWVAGGGVLVLGAAITVAALSGRRR